MSIFQKVLKCGQGKSCVARYQSEAEVKRATLAVRCNPAYELNKRIQRPVPVSFANRGKGAIKRSETNVPGHRGNALQKKKVSALRCWKVCQPIGWRLETTKTDSFLFITEACKQNCGATRVNMPQAAQIYNLFVPQRFHRITRCCPPALPANRQQCDSQRQTICQSNKINQVGDQFGDETSVCWFEYVLHSLIAWLN